MYILTLKSLMNDILINANKSKPFFSFPSCHYSPLRIHYYQPGLHPSLYKADQTFV